jgi:hypothetical protein
VCNNNKYIFRERRKERKKTTTAAAAEREGGRLGLANSLPTNIGLLEKPKRNAAPPLLCVCVLQHSKEEKGKRLKEIEREREIEVFFL